MRKKRWGFIVLGVAAIAITGALYMMSRPAAPSEGGDNAANQSRITFQVTKENLSNTIQVKGKSAYEKETWVYPPYAAEVKAWNIKDGQQVGKGDVLFELEQSKLKGEVELAEANLRKQELDRKLREIRDKLEQFQQQQLSDSAAGETSALARMAKEEEKKAQNELEQIQRKQTETELADKREKLAKSRFGAPEGGIFLFGDKKEPQVVSDGTPVGKIVELSKLQFVSTVGEYEVFQIQPGMSVDVKIDALRQDKLQGKVLRISKFAKTGTDLGSTAAQFEVIISLEPHPKLIAGLNLTGTIQTQKKEGATVVPTLAVMRENDNYFVYVDNNGAIEKRPVKLGMETAEKTEIVEGVKEGETIVLQ